MISTYQYLDTIISGVLGAVLGWGVPRLFQKLKIRREAQLDKKVPELNISGDWTSIFLEETDILNESVNIEQIGRKITATLKLLKRTYEFNGEFKNQILVGSYVSKERRKDERGTIVLRLINENLLSGYCTFIYKNKQVYNSPYVLVSNSSHKPDKGTYHFCNSCVGKFDCCCNCESIDAPILLPFEAEKISVSCRKEINDFAEKLTANLYQMRRDDNDDQKGCIFFQNSMCTIYNNRPLDCRLFPFDFKEIDGKYWVVYYHQICSAIPKDVNEIKMCAHAMRPLLELASPYLSECSNPVFSKRLASQPYKKLFPIGQIMNDTIDS